MALHHDNVLCKAGGMQGTLYIYKVETALDIHTSSINTDSHPPCLEVELVIGLIIEITVVKQAIDDIVNEGVDEGVATDGEDPAHPFSSTRGIGKAGSTNHSC